MRRFLTSPLVSPSMSASRSRSCTEGTHTNINRPHIFPSENAALQLLEHTSTSEPKSESVFLGLKKRDNDISEQIDT